MKKSLYCKDGRKGIYVYGQYLFFSGYMDYAEKLATVAAEISYLSGNIAASDAICERIDHACR